jgi:hypothetical protein
VSIPGRALPATLAKDARSLFWEVDARSLDVQAHRTYILGRVLEYGTGESVRWAVETYGEAAVREFILGRGLQVLSRKTVNYWAILLGLEGEECIQRFLRGPRNPFWPH